MIIEGGRKVFGLDKHKMHVNKWFDYSLIKNSNWTYREYKASSTDNKVTLLDLKFEKEASPFTQAAYLPTIMKAWGLSSILSLSHQLV